MAVIKVCCPYCGDLELSPPDLHLQTYSRGGRDYYEFICPSCTQLIAKPAHPPVVHALRMGQVPETHTVLPDEALDPKREGTPRLDYNDLLDFVLNLGITEDLTAAASS